MLKFILEGIAYSVIFASMLTLMLAYFDVL
jgi:hypothetical protein